ncbi:hypothetical protein HID58_094993 [Brassica napus]|uniref:Uncharacterized protein n=1 Tax=Brassica napus TaxID=3708 RepID=A0ABQ7X7P9_BRANA|nr:hypothetical protein HID58_094993 [Brassica napus]
MQLHSMAPRWKWKETSGSLSSCNVLLAVEPEQAELLDRCCFGRLVLSAEKDKNVFSYPLKKLSICFTISNASKSTSKAVAGERSRHLDVHEITKTKLPDIFKPYSHLRSKNWVLRSGCNTVCISWHTVTNPSLVHSEYSVLVQSGDSNRLRVWSDVHCAVRLSGSVAKTLLTVHVSEWKSKLFVDGAQNSIVKMKPQIQNQMLPLNGSPDVPKKLSPRAARPLKLAALETDSSSSAISANNRIPKDTSPKVSDRKPSPSPFSEKKRPSRITELESLVSQLQGELKKAKHQVSVSETSKKQASKKQKSPRNSYKKFPLSSRRLRIRSWRKKQIKPVLLIIEGWDLEFGATSTNEGTTGCCCSRDPTTQVQIEMVASSEADHVKQAECRKLNGHTLFLVENFSNQLKDCEVTDAETKALATETLRQMENAKKAVEELKSDGTKAVDSYKKMAVELEQSKSRMVWLGGLVTKLLANPGVLENHELCLKKLGESNEMKDEISSLRCEVERLRAALEASGKNDQEGNVKASSRLRIQAELRFELRTAKSKIDKLEARLNQKETDAEAELKQQREIVSDQNETLKSDIHKRETDIQDVLMKLGFAMREAEKNSQRAMQLKRQTQQWNRVRQLKARLVAKETELQFISDETDNVYLLLKNQKETDAEAEAELKQQREADLMDKETQLQIVSDKNETLKSEMGTELRELQVQSNQLREAAEKANAMLSAGNNNNQRNPSYSEDIDDEVQRRKQGISLRRLVFGGRSRRNGWRLQNNNNKVPLIWSLDCKSYSSDSVIDVNY